MIDRKPPRLPVQVALMLIPVSIGWIAFHGAATQDGPSHLAAAKLANEWIGQYVSKEPGGSVFATYRLQIEPVPNWGGQALGMSLAAVLPISITEVAMNLAGLWLPALCLARLVESLRNRPDVVDFKTRKRWTGGIFLAAWIATIAMNVLWTFGFSSFLLGCALAWSFLHSCREYGDAGGNRKWLKLTCLWSCTFLCHLVAFAIAAIVGGLFLCFSPGWSIRRRVLIAAAMATALPLWIRYRNLTAGSRLEPIWEHLKATELLSPRQWARQLGWVDPVSLHSKSWHPITGDGGLFSLIFQPGLWITIALALLVRPVVRALSDEFRLGRGSTEGSFETESRSNPKLPIASSIRTLKLRIPEGLAWAIAVAVLAVLGTLGPDSLGPQQGHYLPQRFCLAALCIIPALIASTRTTVPVTAIFCLCTAWSMQTVSAIDYARRSHNLTRQVRQDRLAMQPGDRILALIDATPWPFRANPRLHADSLLVTAVADTASWNLYEAAHPYFPLRFRELVPGKDPTTLEAFSLATNATDPEHISASVESILKNAGFMTEVFYVAMDRGSPRRAAVMRTIESHTGWVQFRESPGAVIYRKNQVRPASG